MKRVFLLVEVGMDIKTLRCRKEGDYWVAVAKKRCLVMGVLMVGDSQPVLCAATTSTPSGNEWHMPCIQFTSRTLSPGTEVRLTWPYD
jgi:hypothetical protein